jgi:hypothetical protein
MTIIRNLYSFLRLASLIVFNSSWCYKLVFIISAFDLFLLLLFDWRIFHGNAFSIEYLARLNIKVQATLLLGMRTQNITVLVRLSSDYSTLVMKHRLIRMLLQIKVLCLLLLAVLVLLLQQLQLVRLLSLVLKMMTWRQILILL